LLELFSSGLVTLWLNQAGLPPTLNPLDEANQVVLQSAVGMVLPTNADPIATQITTQYLQHLTAQGLNQTEQGIWLQSGATPLATHQGTQRFPGASLTKVAVTLAALQTWPIGHRFTTIVSTTGVLENGTLQGDLVIQGGGDPLFGWESAIAVANQLQALGISRITGDLVIEGPFAVNFKVDPIVAGTLLKQALNPPTALGEMPEALAKHLKTPPARIAIAGKVRVGSSNSPNADRTERFRQSSLPLHQLLRKMNVHSNNVMAQLLTDAMGGHAIVIKTATAAAGVPPAEIQLVNGSGLGVENRLSARSVCALFAAIDRIADRHALTLGDFFPSSGFDIGTLEDRSVPTAAVVKTGTLSTVSALAGVLPTRDRGLVWFTIINRGSDILDLRQQQDLLLQRLQQQWGKPKTPPAMLLPRRESEPEGYTEVFSEP
jgi:serine-type D-Ala-D-Ala carboxypeptidase/endopeptidase (penicillin-binding protein 4)